MSSRRAIFLDRDGTVIRDRDYLREPGGVELLAGAWEALGSFQKANFELIVISNQSGVGRGLMTLEDVASVNDELQRQLRLNGVEIACFYFCPHDPEELCLCRKPSPVLLQKAASDRDLDLPTSFMVGDRSSDVTAGQRAGCRTVLLQSEGGKKEGAGDSLPDQIASNWTEAAAWIFEQLGASLP